MDNISDNNTSLSLRILSRNGDSVSVCCDSVRLVATDDADGRNGGSFGIRKGHMPMMSVLGEGNIIASQNGNIIYEATLKGGIAYVENDVITVLNN